MKKILSIALVLASFITSLVNAQVIPPQKRFVALPIPLAFYKNEARKILKRFDFKNTHNIRAYLQQRIEVIHVACSQTEDFSLLSQEYALLGGDSDAALPAFLKQPKFFEDCFLGTVVDCAQEYANAYIRLMCNCREKNFHARSFELSNLLEDLPAVLPQEVETKIAAKISDVQIMRVHVRQFSKLACALLEEFDNQEKEIAATNVQSPDDGSDQTRSQIVPSLQSDIQDSIASCSAHTW